jgi:hypothetical protein
VKKKMSGEDTRNESAHLVINYRQGRLATLPPAGVGSCVVSHLCFLCYVI